MITVPQPTVEKPLSVIDYCAALSQCVSVAEVGRFGEACPEWVRADERFTKAVAARLMAIKERKAAA